MALVHHNGRAFTRQSTEDLEALFMEELKGYSNDDRKLVLKIVADRLKAKEQKARGKTLYDLLGDAHFKSPPVSIREFVTNDYYLGRIGRDIYPQLLEDLEEVFEGNYSEIIFTGAIGTGKTFASSIGVCYLIYLLSLMRHPQRSFGLSEDTMIAIAGFSVSEDLARDVVLKHIIGKISSSDYFKQHFTPKVSQKKMRFKYPDGTYAPVEVVARATTDRGALGMAIFSAIMDESDFMPKKKKNVPGVDRFGLESMAKAIYDGIKRRMKSRFGKNGKLFLPCSKTTFDSFIQQRIKAAATDPTIFVRDYALWDVKPGDYDEERFWVLCGNEQVNSKIITDEVELARIKESIPERAALIDVPMDFLPEFESDLEGAIRDTAGIATAAVSPFMQQRHKIAQMVHPDLSHPYSTDELDPSLGGQFLWNKMVRPYRVHDPYGGVMDVLKPILNPSAARHVHIDAALSSCAAAIVMAHHAGNVQVKKTGYYDSAPLMIVDFMLRIVPPPGGEIELSMLRNIVFSLAHQGFRIERITMDQFQSADSLQQYRAQGYEAERQPTNWDIYQCLKNAIYEGRVLCYQYEPLLRELRGLECDWERRKIIKPDRFEGERGSKDLADALASVIYSLSTTPSRVALPMLKGFSGIQAEGNGTPQWAVGAGTTPGVQSGHLPPQHGYNARMPGGQMPYFTQGPQAPYAAQPTPFTPPGARPIVPPILFGNGGGWSPYGRG